MISFNEVQCKYFMFDPDWQGELVCHKNMYIKKELVCVRGEILDMNQVFNLIIDYRRNNEKEYTGAKNK